MASLSSSLSIAAQALNADTGALQITDNNISNANTPGYTRELPVFEEVAPTQNGGQDTGSGVVLQGYQSVRDELLQSRIEQETQAQSSANAQLTTLQQIQTTFTSSSQDIGTEISALFSSLSALSTNPTSSSLRQAVLSAGQNLATAFNTASSALTSAQSGLNTQITQDVSQVNKLSQQIAALNPQIAGLQASGQNTGTLQDQQDQLVLDLSALTNVSLTQTSEGITVATANGTPLVVGTQSYTLQTATGAGGNLQVLDQNGNNITSSISGGDLGGTLQTQGQTIPGLLTSLDTLANELGSAFNSVQAEGYDQNGKAGTNFFNVPSTVAGSAAAISVALTNPANIAASSDGTSGSDGNLANFAAIQNNALSSGQTPEDAYASLVYQVGSLTDNAQAEQTAATSSLQQLNDQLSSVSGVSIDEETTNLITYQNAYEAAARVITTIQSLFETTMLMGTAAAE
ncbi:MAG: flagellar hook-associated protein FlgK [Acidobacteriaceae bacterium]